MDLFWFGVVAVLVIATLGLIAVCEPPRQGKR